MGNDLMEGIRAALKETGSGEFEFIIANIGFGEDEKQAFHETEKLLLHEKCNLVIGFLDHRLARLLDPLFLATGKLFIVINPGANHPQNWVAPRTTVFLTLLNSFLSYLTGRLAVTEGHTRGALAASYYDGGYNLCAAIVDGFLQAGGEMKVNFISGHQLEEFNIDSLVKAGREQDVNSCLSVFSGKESQVFLDAINKSDMNAALYASPMMFDEQYQGNESREASFQGYVPWHGNIPSGENEKFKMILMKNTGRPANIFSLLGWETGLLLSGLAGIPPSNGEAQVSLLKGKRIDSPRGSAYIDEETHYFIPEVYRASSIKGSVSVDVFEETLKTWTEFRERSVDTRASGWNNTYLCY